MPDAVESFDKLNEPPTWRMTAFAAATLLVIWLYFLYPFVRFQFWQSDTFWLIEIGRRIVETHSLPNHDLYSYTATTPHWTVYQWLTEVLFSMANDIGGLTGVAVFGEAVLAILFCVLIPRYLLNLRINAIVAAAASWISAYAFFPDLSSLRPQLISFVLFWFLSVICNQVKAKSSPKIEPSTAVKLTFLIAVLWANCHVSFPMGMLLIAANLLGSIALYLLKKSSFKNVKIFAVMLALFTIGSWCTPHGLALYWFMLSLRNLIPIQELQPLVYSKQLALAAFCLASFLSALYIRKKLDISDFIIMVSLFLIGSNCGRLIVYFCIFSSVPLALAGNQLLMPIMRVQLLANFSQACGKVVFSAFYLPAIVLMSAWVVMSQPLFIPNRVPLRAANFLLTHPMAGNLFCTSHAGSYLIYSSRGKIPVFLDTRMDLYNEDFCYNFSRALNDADGWQQLFARYKIKEAILPNRTKLREVLDTNTDWKPVYRDSDFTVYISADEMLKVNHESDTP